ncbi:bifunctional DNA-formamidopyrimidine glycosylase/DNA-(apurinic or apyrimidinic site) lyase [Alloacidobacterium sp.]|uniref:bifunctional DNA-formamidopyrimidine glycosylase/DNA-(apurinic or apyrimidinic site) lyase n=1 Tax=Alloacidobacterium sp. TaxID=2951999 RepID=UPI002D2527E8|nr:bifunctional DNA-formamidopyrimidine glycosylase/DNA-(apurinic or apyrimidinic site) lyase [Alloacidobacterium sp.]HYK37153.1 bifunctional DNA-formamidopyrimidine glycosylase/DNA-(apurinic or apyrimidinic site) lyase [Alloacidobacterium sp.]
MPELPEVETVANGVNQRVRGERIESVWLGSKPEPFKTGPSEMAKILTGRRIERVYRIGKHIVFDLDGNDAPQWIVHLGMTGRLLVSAASASVPLHTHAILKLTTGRELRFVDPRRFGRLALQKRVNSSGFQGPGHEPLTISIEQFTSLFRGRKTTIKAALLNQKLLHGVGNIYADESLFRVGIRPTRMAGRLTREQLARLRSALQEVMQHAIAMGGSSVSDYVDADGVKGYFQLEHRVYMRGGQPCLVCGTSIRRIVLAGRGTHFCPMCQK